MKKVLLLMAAVAFAISGIVYCSRRSAAVPVAVPAPEIKEEFYNMDNATKIVVHVDNLSIQNGYLYFDGRVVEFDPSIDIVALIEAKEEIMIRVSDFDRISIIEGDNGQF